MRFLWLGMIGVVKMPVSIEAKYSYRHLGAKMLIFFIYFLFSFLFYFIFIFFLLALQCFTVLHVM